MQDEKAPLEYYYHCLGCKKAVAVHRSELEWILSKGYSFPKKCKGCKPTKKEKVTGVKSPK